MNHVLHEFNQICDGSSQMNMELCKIEGTIRTGYVLAGITHYACLMSNYGAANPDTEPQRWIFHLMPYFRHLLPLFQFWRRP